MKFKTPTMKRQFGDIPKLLKIIIKDADDFSQEHFDKELIITRVSDRVFGESGVHPLNRAVDIRDKYRGEFSFSEDERLAIVHFINAKYSRRDKYKTVLWHPFNDGPEHFHFQVPADMLNL